MIGSFQVAYAQPQRSVQPQRSSAEQVEGNREDRPAQAEGEHETTSAGGKEVEGNREDRPARAEGGHDPPQAQAQAQRPSYKFDSVKTRSKHGQVREQHYRQGACAV